MIYDKEKLILFIERSIEKYGRLPNEMEVRKEKLISWRCSSDYGGYKGLIESLGFEYTRVCNFGVFYNLTEDEIISVFNSFYVDNSPTLNQIYSDYKSGKFPFSSHMIKERYKSYNDFLKVCGRDKSKRKKRKLPSEIQSKKVAKVIPYVDYTKEDCISILKKALDGEEEFSYRAIPKMYNKKIIPFGTQIIITRFCGINEMLLEIGRRDLIKVRRYDYYSKEEMASIFKEIYKESPTQLEIISDFKCKIIPFNITDIVKKFGSYSLFLLENGYDYTKGLYSQKYIGVNGEVCDSKSELKIDRFLHENNITHSHHGRYSDIKKGVGIEYQVSKKCDFLLSDNTIVEYFGLQGNKKYDEKTKKKLKILEDNKMKYIAIYPKDLKRLDIIFADYIERGN